jgi:hypothetical protein
MQALQPRRLVRLNFWTLRRAEREEIARAILALEGLGGKRRGRPPKWMKAGKKPTQMEQKKPVDRSKNTEN